MFPSLLLGRHHFRNADIEFLDESVDGGILGGDYLGDYDGGVWTGG